MDPSVWRNHGKLDNTTDMSNPWLFFSSFSGSLQHSSTESTSHQVMIGTTIPDPILQPASTGVAVLMSPGQASLLGALLSLDSPAAPNSSPQHPHPTTDSPPDPNTALVSNWSVFDTKRQDDATTQEDEDPEGVVSVICRQLALDKTAEGNALPFVLQSYATWIRRMAFEPLKLTHTARDFVFSHFEDGGQSRWILSLLAHIGSKIGSVDFVEGKHYSTLSALQTAVRWQLGAANAGDNSSRPELVKALDSAVQTLIMHFFVSPISDVITLRREAAPIFRQLCADPSDTSVDLPSLLQHPLGCVRHYAHIDILFGVVMDVPTLFRYEVPNPGNRSWNSHRSVPTMQEHSGLQWLHGIPDLLILLFAKIKLMRQDGSMPNEEMIASFEQDIRELQSFSGSSSESFLVIALCGDPCDTPRVKKALKQFIKLLNGIRPGRLPDEFLIMNLLLAAPAAQRKRDREIIRQRFLIIYTLGRTFCTTNSIICVIEDYWARADAEGRPTTWSDVAVSRKRVVNI
ncbi:unnamed protein product [Rhizoctonia solani]|uniref:Uncharacterized protein n=1 Tax=Rhizoctonia solani TaxID=456999 RepID=A0A8H3BWB4_9AGAM|nr:unnamed protein product [Rhizoctonia solani]